MAVDALPIFVLSSASRDRLPEMVEPRYVKFSTTSRVWAPMAIAAAESASWPMMWVFLRLIVRRNSVQASGKRVVITLLHIKIAH